MLINPVPYLINRVCTGKYLPEVFVRTKRRRREVCVKISKVNTSFPVQTEQIRLIKLRLHTAINRSDFVSWWMWFNVQKYSGIFWMWFNPQKYSGIFSRMHFVTFVYIRVLRHLLYGFWFIILSLLTLRLRSSDVNDVAVTLPFDFVRFASYSPLLGTHFPRL